MISRRNLLKLSAIGAFVAVAPGFYARNPPLKAVSFSQDHYSKFPLLGLATSLSTEHAYQATVEGQLPAGLNGVLYRNGPGLFQRGKYRKRCLLDGDGMVQSFTLRDGVAHYRNRFVRTPKFMAEQEAGKFLYPTWTTQAPGGFWSNLFRQDLRNQAGVTVVQKGGRLYAFDEFKPPFRLDPESLETLGEDWLGLAPKSTTVSAHSRIDPRTGEWVHFGIQYARHATLHLTTLRSDGGLKHHRTYPLPRYPYFHDFFLTEKHVVFLLPPLELSPFKLILGRNAFTGALSWRPEMGSRVLVFRRDSDEPPLQLEAPPCWIWHNFNAYDAGNEIVADFVGYDFPDHFLGQDPALFAIMEGRRGTYNYPGTTRRLRIDTRTKRLTLETVAEDNQEFPTINPSQIGQTARYGYAARIRSDQSFFSAIGRTDFKTGRSDEYDFGPGFFTSEPVFVPDPKGASTDQGWLLTQVFDGNRQLSFLSILRAEALFDGPLANVILHHHVPLGFHGWWAPAQDTV